jgi:hypothetical protein
VRVLVKSPPVPVFVSSLWPGQLNGEVGAPKAASVTAGLTDGAYEKKVSSFLAGTKTDDEKKLAVEGLRYLRASFEHGR